MITVLASVGLARRAHGDDVDGWLGAGFFLVLAVLAVVFQFGLRERMHGRALRRHPERAPLLERLQRQRGWWSLVAPIVMVWFAARAFEHDAPWAWCYLAAAVLLIVSMAVHFFRPRSVAERAARPRERR